MCLLKVFFFNHGKSAFCTTMCFFSNHQTSKSKVKGMKSYPVKNSGSLISHEIRILSLTYQELMECHVRALIIGKLFAVRKADNEPFGDGRRCNEFSSKYNNPNAQCMVYLPTFRP